MQTKSEMINRIAELAKENAELKAYKDVNEDFKTAWEELKAELQIRDNIAEHFRKEALSWANIANECQKDKTKLENKLQLRMANDKESNEYWLVLQKIKEIAECDCGYCKNYRCPRMDNILDLITKAEEE